MRFGTKRNQDNFAANRGSHGAEQYYQVDRRQRQQPQEKERVHPSNYSDGGHGTVEGGESKTAADQHEIDEISFTSNDEFLPHLEENDIDEEDDDEDEVDDLQAKDIEDDRFNQSDAFPQDRYNEISQDRHREFLQDHIYQQTNREPNSNFRYHYGTDDLEERARQDQRRGRHYREY